ncbi:MAG TPA: hypothetical protein PKY81_15310 [bacterium]|nr:hypothetical protein [bacterium]
MKLSKLKTLIEILTKFDDGFEEKDIIVNANFGLLILQGFIINYSEEYYRKYAEYSLSNVFNQSFKLPEDYFGNGRVEYIENEMICEIKKITGDLKYKNKNQFYEIKYPDISFYNIKNQVTVKFEYIYKPAEIPVEAADFEIDIPACAELLFEWNVLKYLHIEDREIEKILMIDYESAYNNLIKTLKSNDNEFTENYNDFNSFFGDDGE